MLDQELPGQLDEMKNQGSARKDIDNRKALKLSTARKRRLLNQNASVETVIQATIRPSFTQAKHKRRGSDFEKALKNHT